MMKINRIVQSLQRNGNSHDNEMMENYFGLVNKELQYMNQIESIEDFEQELNIY